MTTATQQKLTEQKLLTFNDIKINNFALVDFYITRSKDLKTGEVSFTGFLNGKTFHVSKGFFYSFSNKRLLHQTAKDSFLANRVLNKLVIQDRQLLEKTAQTVMDSLPVGIKEIRTNNGEDVVDELAIDWKQNIQDFFDLKPFYTLEKTYYTKAPAFDESKNPKDTSFRKSQTIRLSLESNYKLGTTPLFNIKGSIDLFRTEFDKPYNLSTISDRRGKGVKATSLIRGTNGSFKVVKFKLSDINKYGHNFDGTTYPETLLDKQLQSTYYKILMNANSKDLYGFGVDKKQLSDFFVRPQYYGKVSLNIPKSGGGSWESKILTMTDPVSHMSWHQDSKYLAGLPAVTWMALFYVLSKVEEYSKDESLQKHVEQLFKVLNISDKSEIDTKTFKFLDFQTLLDVNTALVPFDLDGVLPEVKFKLTGKLDQNIPTFVNKNTEFVNHPTLQGVFKITDPNLADMKVLYNFGAKFGRYVAEDYPDTTHFIQLMLSMGERYVYFNYPIQSSIIKWDNINKKHTVEPDPELNIVGKMIDTFKDFINRSKDGAEFNMEVIPCYDVYDDNKTYIYLAPKLPKLQVQVNYGPNPIDYDKITNELLDKELAQKVEEPLTSSLESVEKQVVQPTTQPEESKDSEDEWSLDSILV